MISNRIKAGNPGEPMVCDAASRGARERAMIKLAQRPGYVGYSVRQKLKDDFTLQGVARAFNTSEWCAWGLMMVPVEPVPSVA